MGIHFFTKNSLSAPKRRVLQISMGQNFPMHYSLSYDGSELPLRYLKNSQEFNTSTSLSANQMHQLYVVNQPIRRCLFSIGLTTVATYCLCMRRGRSK